MARNGGPPVNRTAARRVALRGARTFAATGGVSKRGPRRTADARLVRRADEWQRDALTFYEDLPEVGFAVDYKAQAVAACGWQVVYDDPDLGERPVDDEEVEGLISALRGPVGDEQELRRRAAVLVETTGEAWLLGSAVPDGEAEDGEPGTWWEFLSVLEIMPPATQGAPWLRSRDGQAKEPIPPDAYQSRLYRPSAAYSALAHSALRRCLGTCQELDMLNRMSAAVITSRLPMGLLLIPESMTWLSPLHRVDETAGSSVDGDSEQQDFMDALMEHMSAPVTDPGSAASITPIVVQGTKDEIAAVKVVELARQLDARVRDMRSELTERLAVGMDIPPEILQGKGGLNHWCVDAATEALTINGWRAHDQLRRGDVVLTLDHETGLAAWQPVEQVARFNVAALPMVSIEGVGHSSLSTWNHRWPVIDGDGGRAWATSETLSPTDRLGPGPRPEPVIVGDLKVTEVAYTGVVWCPTTGNGTWLARRDGAVYVTGNTGWSVDADFLFRHVKPLGDLICQFLTMEYLRPLLAEMGRPDVGRYTLLFDPAPLASRDDDDSKATTMFDRGLLSERETVSRQGWDPDAVMPDEAETARRRAWRLVEERILRPTVEGLEALGLDPAWFDLGAPVAEPVEPVADGGGDASPPDRNSGPPEQDDAGEALPGDQALAGLVGRLAERADAAVERAGERALNRAKNDRRRANGNAASREVSGFVDLTDAEIGTLRPVVRADPAFRELADAAGEAIWATVRGTQRRRAARPTARQADDIAVAARGFAEAVAGWTADALRTGWDRSSPGGHRVPLVLVEQPVAMFFGAGHHRKAVA